MPTAPLSAYDRLFLAGHEALQRRGLPGHHCFIWLDLTSPIDRAVLDAAYLAASRKIPLVSAGIEYSIMLARARWRYSFSETDVAPIESHDLTVSPHPTAAIQAEILSALREPLDPAEGRQLRLYYFEHAGGATLVLRWPHYLMDLEGAQGFLLEMQQASASMAANDGGREPPLAYPPAWSRHYLRRWWSGVTRHRAVARLQARQFPEHHIDPHATADFIIRKWSVAQSAAVTDAAKRLHRSGPMLHTRHLLTASLRGLDDLADELGMTPGDHYLVPLPMLRPRRTPRTKLACNDLIIATIVINRELLRDPAALDASLMSQIDEYVRGGDEATWLFMSYVGLLRKSHYEWMLRRQRMMARCSIGFTMFRAEPWSHGLLGVGVSNAYACGLPPIPPGVMLSFMRFGDRLNLGATFFPHVCTAAKVERLVERIEHHIGATK